jgi:lysophospholipase
MKALFHPLLPSMLLVVGLGPLSCGDDTTPAKDIRGDMEQGKITGCSGQIAYQRWMWQGDAEATFIFLNGRTEYTDKHHRMIPLIDRPWNIVMFDHFGQGRSDGPRAHADDFEAQHVCDFGEVIDQLAPKDVPIVVGSHSMGGFVSTRFAQLHPGVAKAYVFGSPMYRVPFDGLPDETVKGVADNAVAKGDGEVPCKPYTPRVPCAENVVTHDCEFYDEVKDDPITDIGQPTWGYLSAYFPMREALLAGTASITEPMLIFQAGLETVVIPEAQDELCDKVNETHADLCRIEVFPNDFHEIFNELDRAVAVTKMLEFFDEALAAD